MDFIPSATESALPIIKHTFKLFVNLFYIFILFAGILFKYFPACAEGEAGMITVDRPSYGFRISYPEALFIEDLLLHDMLLGFFLSPRTASDGAKSQSVSYPQFFATRLPEPLPKSEEGISKFLDAWLSLNPHADDGTSRIVLQEAVSSPNSAGDAPLLVEVEYQQAQQLFHETVLFHPVSERDSLAFSFRNEAARDAEFAEIRLKMLSSISLIPRETKFLLPEVPSSWWRNNFSLKAVGVLLLAALAWRLFQRSRGTKLPAKHPEGQPSDSWR